MYNTANNSFGKLESSIWPSATSFIMQSQYSDLFPDHIGVDYFLKLEQKNELWEIVKREIVLVTNKAGDIFTITRGAWFCPASDTATTQTNTSFSFNAGDSVSLTVVSEHIQQMDTDIATLQTTKANDNVVVKLTGDQTIAWVKTFASSPKAPLPTEDDDVATKQYIQNSLIVQALEKSWFVAWEAIDKWQFFRKWLWTSIFIQNTTAPFSWAWVSACSIWYSTSQYEFWQWINLTSNTMIFDIQLNLISSWSPNFQVNIELFSDAWFTTLIWISETKTLTWWWIITFVFPTPISRTAWMIYFKANLVSW